MSALLNKRLARSLWRTKLRLLAVVMMVSVGVFAGITFGGYSHNLDGMYETLQADDEDGANLADLWIDNRSGTWSAEEAATFCDALESSWPSTGAALDSCEWRNIVQGTSSTPTTRARTSSTHFGTAFPTMPTPTKYGCLTTTPKVGSLRPMMRS